jgi:hypothetical protein
MPIVSGRVRLSQRTKCLSVKGILTGDSVRIGIALILGLVLAGVTACTGQPPPGSTPEIEHTKLDDVAGSAVARMVLDPKAGPIVKFPVITDNESSVSQYLIQPTTDGPGGQQGLINALKRAKAQGAHFHSADCSLPRTIKIGGSVAISSSQFASDWQAHLVVSEGPTRTYVQPKDAHATATKLTGKTLQIQVEIWVGGGTDALRRNPPTASATPEPMTCSKAIAALLE